MLKEAGSSYEEKLKFLGIKLGVQVEKKGSGSIAIPKKPHVFFCNDFYFSVSPNTTGVIREMQAVLGQPGIGLTRIDGKRRLAFHLPNVTIILGHAGYESDDKNVWNWNFDGSLGFPRYRSVLESVEEYEKIAQDMDWPNIDIILACRKSPHLSTRQETQKVFQQMQIPHIVPCGQLYSPVCNDFSSEVLPNGSVRFIAEANSWLNLDAWIRYRSQNFKHRFSPDNPSRIVRR